MTSSTAWAEAARTCSSSGREEAKHTRRPRWPGAVETLCRRSKEGDAAAACVDDFLNCLDEHAAMRSINVDKSFAHAYLTTTENPVARVGEGAMQGAWDFESPAFTELADFLRELASRGQ